MCFLSVVLDVEVMYTCIHTNYIVISRRALRHCIATFLAAVTRTRGSSEEGWRVPQNLMQKLQDLAEHGNTQKSV